VSLRCGAKAVATLGGRGQCGLRDQPGCSRVIDRPVSPNEGLCCGGPG
jgi:hypothetical protein